MKIGVDLDGVVLEFQRTWARLYEEWFDILVPTAGLNEYDALQDLTHFENTKEFFEWFTRAGGWQNMPWIPGAPGGIDGLLFDRGHDVVFVTARRSEARDDTKAWHFYSPWRHNTTLVFKSEKSRADCDLYIDDSPHIVKELVAQGKPVILLDQPWNRGVAVSTLTVRALDWHEVLMLVDRFEKQQNLLPPSEKKAVAV